MATKNFKYAENQKLWDSYTQLKISEGRPQMSINQYKPALLHLESHTDKKFSQTTGEEIEIALTARDFKNANHLNGFYLTCINQSWIKPTKDMAIYLLPTEHKKMINSLFS